MGASPQLLPDFGRRWNRDCSKLIKDREPVLIGRPLTVLTLGGDVLTEGGASG